MYKRCLLFLLLFIVTDVFAQNSELEKQLDAFEKSTAHKADITELKKMLSSSNLTATETIAVQTVLVHKYQQLKQWDICLNYCQSQVALAHQQNNSLAEATFYKLMGGTYYYIPQKENAIVYWKKCIEIAEPNRYISLLAQCYHNVGVISFEGTDYKLAEKYFIKAIDLSKQNNDTASATINLHYRLLATTYDAENMLDKAERIFKEIIAKTRASKDSANLAESLLFYTNVLKKKNEFEKAILLSQEALVIARKINLIDGVITALNTHAGNLAAAQNYKESYQYKGEETELVKTRFNGDLNKKISDAEAVFKTAELQYENEIASINAKKEKQIYITAFAGLFLLAGFTSYFIYQRRSIRQKIQMQLQMQEEKERLSRDLHDNLGSQMALLSNNIENLDTNYRKQTGIDESIDRVKGTAKQLLQTLRETIWILNKEHISAENFFDKLVEYTRRYLQSYPEIKLQVTELFSGSKELNSNEALQLFRLCQEAITNSCKYADSKILELQGNTEQNKFTICIKDYGKGFDAKLIQAEGQYGLRNMRKRAHSVNAEIEILSAANKGVTISIKI